MEVPDRVELGPDLVVGREQAVPLLVDRSPHVSLGRRRQVQLARHGNLDEADQRRLERP